MIRMTYVLYTYTYIHIIYAYIHIIYIYTRRKIELFYPLRTCVAQCYETVVSSVV